MQITITLTDTDLARLDEIRKLREAQGRKWYPLEVEVGFVASHGIFELLREERGHAEAMQETPALLARQAS